MAMTLKIEGLAEVNRALDQFAASTRRGILNRVLRKAAAPVVSSAKQMAPKDTGELRESISTQIVRSNAGKSAFAAAMRGGASRAEAGAAARTANAEARGQGASAVVRIRARAPHAFFNEFGTTKMAAQPFLGPALRQNKGRVVSIIAHDLKTEIAATARRVAARNARKGK